MQTYENPDIDPQTWTWSPGQFTHRYGQEFSYDPNGNILTQDRLDHTGSSSGVIDELEYHYYPGTNRLEYVNNHSQGVHLPGVTSPVPDQDPGNYEYDGAGNLILDNKPSQDQTVLTMDWTPKGKLHTVRREESIYTVHESRFGYDPAGQRIKKQIVEETYEDVFPTPPEKESDPIDPPPELVGIDTISTLWYIRDATGNVLAVYEQVGDTMHWREQHLYGSSRLGMVLPAVKRYPGDGLADGPYFIEESKEQPYGARRYEITNHLGNVTTVVSDRKVPVEDGGNITYEAAVHSAMDYYPFGSLMPGRGFGAEGEDYRYGFNTQEREDEIKGEGKHYSAEFWQYDPRVIHRWNLDPRPNPAMSGYAILGGNPVYYTDWAGDTTRIYSEAGEYHFSLYDGLPNEDHFFSEDKISSLKHGFNTNPKDADRVAKVLREHSSFFIGANTRDQLQALQRLYETEAAFVLSPNNCRELVVCDISHLSDPPATPHNISINSTSIWSYFDATEYRALVGFGHTHLGSSTPSGYEVLKIRPHGDYYPILHHRENYKPRQLLLTAGENDFSIYTSRKGIYERNIGSYQYENPRNPPTKINYDGTR